MKNKGIIILIITLIVIALVTGLAFLTLYFINRQPINKIDLAALENKEDVKIVYEEDSEIPTLIAGKYTEFKVNSGNEAIRALEEVKDVIGIQNPKEEYKVSNEIEILNSNVYRMQQYYKGIQVLGRQMVMATDKEGNIKTLSGDYVKIENLDVTPSINQNGAISVITGKYGTNIKVEQIQLVIKYINDVPTLCWGISAYGEFNGLTGISYYFYVNAKTGEIADTVEGQKNSIALSSGTGISGETLNFYTNKTGNKYEMYDPERNIEIRNYRGEAINVYFSEAITSEDNTWIYPAANEAMVNIGKAYDYFNTKFDIKSVDDKGSKITVVVNDYAVPNNASFIDNIGDVIVLGMGDGITCRNFANGLDVLGHEFMHGYIRNTDKNIFDDQGFVKGEVDEAFCDVMGNIIENYYLEKSEIKSVTHNENLTFVNEPSWLLGEDVVIEQNKRFEEHVKSRSKWKPKQIWR